ncbi:MAG: PriCT-2 domain-containing protein, partial [Afipia sp.]|nr:PriCT-2 domain-containing protein [Afipia sp.]
LESYKGVEFKSAGRQVVAAGSIHPETKKHYVWDDEGAQIADGLPDAPASLLNLIRRPERTLSGGAGQYTNEQIAAALDALDPTDFNDNAKWFPIIASVHHASGGDARQEFIDWSTGDSAFRNEAYDIGRRWDSFHAEKGYTSKTLEYHLRKAGHPELQIAGNAADDFDDLPPDDDWMDGATGEEFDFDAPASVPPIKWDMTKLPEMLDHAESAMLAAGVPLYRMGDRLVHPVRTEADSSDADSVRRKAGSLTVHEVSALRLREFMIESVPFYTVKNGKKGDATRVRFAAPMMLANHYLARGDRWRVPVLNGVIETPTLRGDGTLLEDDGYDPASGLLLDKGGVEYPTIPDEPTREDAESALALLKEPFKDFPFVKNAKGESASHSVMLSAVLTGVVRRTLHSAPMHGTSAPTMG